MRTLLALAVGCCLLIALPASARTSAAGIDWARFGYDTARHGSAPGSGITAANAKRLIRRQVQLGGTVDSSPIYLHDVQVHGSSHDTFFVTTTYGKTEAIDASSGRILWTFTPSSYLQRRRLGPDHERDARGVDRPQRDLRRLAGRRDPEAARLGRQGVVGDDDHA